MLHCFVIILVIVNVHEFISGRITEIAASHYGHLSACLAHLTSTCFMYVHSYALYFIKILLIISNIRWGQCHGQSVVSPIETPFQSLHEVFHGFSHPCITPFPFEAEMPLGPTLLESFKMAFDDAETADVKFLCEGREINAHKALLKIRCEHFRSMFNDGWRENGQEVVEISQFTYPVSCFHEIFQKSVTVNFHNFLGLSSLFELSLLR